MSELWLRICLSPLTMLFPRHRLYNSMLQPHKPWYHSLTFYYIIGLTLIFYYCYGNKSLWCSLPYLSFAIITLTYVLHDVHVHVETEMQHYVRIKICSLQTVGCISNLSLLGVTFWDTVCRSTFDENMREKRCLHFRSRWPWPLTFRPQNFSAS